MIFRVYKGTERADRIRFPWRYREERVVEGGGKIADEGVRKSRRRRRQWGCRRRRRGDRRRRGHRAAE